MSEKREFPQTEFDEVHQLIKLAQERIEEGPSNKEWLFDFNLPDLYVAIGSLYAALGDTERLERAQASLASQESPPPSLK